MQSWKDADAHIRGGRNPDIRRVGNNTDAIRRHAPGCAQARGYRPGPCQCDIAIRLHRTDVVTYHHNGSATLSARGWHTVTTASRINGFSPARVYSARGTWCIWHPSDPLTAPRMVKCRGETSWHHGRNRHACVDGRVTRERFERMLCDSPDCDEQWAHRRWNGAADAWEPAEHLVSVGISTAACERCQGTGKVDQGSRPDPIIFADGIRVDPTGRVLNARSHTRMSQAKERERVRAERAKRAAARMARQLRKTHYLTTSDGRTPFYKGVNVGSDGAGYSPVQRGELRYVVGATVVADRLNRDPMDACAHGINMCATVDGARGFGDGRILVLTVPEGEDIVMRPDKCRAARVQVVGSFDGNRVHA